ncbi:hypothetical protein Pan216_07480 [Planctomycetes bacterium Pan216]|uniref:RND transporter n=1 Tax=Kolteria novifilia TaxID=2527975 RepID=A0A518AYW8_9BACT|nr:hypothetical protein Pan216_07480 [Planctomycetes bacterium Pan216]
MTSWQRMIALGVTGMASVMFVGCGGSTTESTGSAAGEAEEHQHAHEHDHAHGESEHSQGGWWCVEHGVPEEVCTRCSPQLAAAFQKKGDWCEEHSLPDSQCFTCNPELEAKFAAQYEAKFGYKPPKPTE